jgi:serine/threonine protein kinase
MSELNALNILNQIGEGAFSKVYQAIDLFSNKQIAIKVAKPNKSLEDEFKILKTLTGIT